MGVSPVPVKMEEKASLLPQTEQPMPRRPVRFGRLSALASALLLGLFWLAMTWDCGHDHAREARTELPKVPLEVHVMSKCPDARDCLEKLVVPTMANVSDLVDFRLSYIGKITEEDGGVECMHGQTECLGNIIELCAANEYPDPKIYLGFTMCLFKDYKRIPEEDFIRDCALEHGIEFDKLNECLSRDDGAFGMNLLRDSVERSKNLGVTVSCTVRLDEKIRCIRDGGKWKKCKGASQPDELIREIENFYNKKQG